MEDFKKYKNKMLMLIIVFFIYSVITFLERDIILPFFITAAILYVYVKCFFEERKEKKQLVKLKNKNQDDENHLT